MLRLPDVRGALEHHVLEQVGEAGLARDLVLRADVVPDVHRRDGREVVLRDDQPEAVGQPRLREVDGGNEHPRMLAQRRQLGMATCRDPLGERSDVGDLGDDVGVERLGRGDRGLDRGQARDALGDRSVADLGGVTDRTRARRRRVDDEPDARRTG